VFKEQQMEEDPQSVKLLLTETFL